MPVVRKIVREATPIEILAVTGASLAGMALASMAGIIAQIPGLLFAIPAFLNMRGEVFSSMGARLSTKLHLGVVEPKYLPSGPVKSDIIAYITLGGQKVILISLLSYSFSLLMGSSPDLLILLSILGLALLISTAIMIPITLVAGIHFFKRGYDPENVIGPITTSTSDMVGLYSLILSAMLLGV